MPLVSKGTRGPKASWHPRKSSPVTIIHVNQHTIRQNQKREQAAPAISAKRGKENIYGHEVKIHGPCRVVYRPDTPLSCGARVWIETVSTVEVINHLQVKPRLLLWECFRDCLAFVVSEANRARSLCNLSDYKGQ